jgi:hypothetical protein
VGVQSRMSQRVASNRKGQPFRGAGDQTVNLGGGQPDAAFGQVWHELGDGEHTSGGHQLSQAPPIADLAWHHEILPGRRAASMMASRTRRRERVRKSEETQV